MCGRYYVDDDTAREIERLVRNVDSKIGHQGNRDIHPSESAAVLTGRPTVLSEMPGATLNGQYPALFAEIMHWGFPQYQRRGLLINARSETVLERRMFRDSVLHRRCIIPAKHFYEWDSEKTKVTFFREGCPAVYMAGFYNCFQGEDRFIILTTAANASVERIHDRMPLILEENELEAWIYDDHFFEMALHKQSPKLQQYQPYVQQSLF